MPLHGRLHNVGISRAEGALKIGTAKAKTRGYRTVENLITIAYLIAGQLRFNGPHFR